MIANLVYIIHVFLLIMVFLSVFLPSGEWLKYIIIFIPLIFLDWKDSDEQCSLTSLQAKLKGTWKPGNSDDKNAPEFFRPLLNKVLKPFGIKIKSRKTAGRINNIMFLSILVINIVRYAKFKNISFKPNTTIGKIYYNSILMFGGLYIVDKLYPVSK